MTEKRFQIDDDGDITEFKNQQWVDTWEYGNGKHWDSLCKKLNELYDENEQLKQDKKRLIGFLHRYKGVDVEDVDEEVLSKEYLDEWGELYND